MNSFGRTCLMLCWFPLAAFAEPADPPRTESVKNVDLYGDPLPNGAVARLGSIRWRHPFEPTGGVGRVACSPDGRYLALVAENQLAVLRVSDGRPVSWFDKDLTVTASVFSADGKFLLTEGPSPAADFIDSENLQPRLLQFWQVGTGKLIRTVEIKRFLDSSAYAKFSSDGRFLWAVENEKENWKVTLWDTSTGKRVASFPTALRWGNSMTVSPDAHWVAVADFKSLIVYDLTRNKPVSRYSYKAPKGGYRRVVFSPDSRYLVACSSTSTEVWSTTTGKRVAHLEDCEGNTVFSPDGKRMVCVTRKHVRVFGVPSFDELHRSEPHGDTIRSLLFCKSGQRALVTYRYHVDVWDVHTGKPKDAVPRHRSLITALCFSPDGRYLASGAHDPAAYVWDWRTGKARHRLPGHSSSVTSLLFSADGKILVTGDGRRSGSWTGQPGEATIRYWNLQTGKKFAEFSAHRGGILELRFSPDEQILYSLGTDLRVCAWDVAGHRRLFQIREVHRDAFDLSADGSKLLLGSEGTLGLWDAKTGKHLQNLGVKAEGKMRFLSGTNDILVQSNLERPDARFPTRRTVQVPMFRRIDLGSLKVTQTQELQNSSTRGESVRLLGRETAITVPDSYHFSLWDHATGTLIKSYLARHAPQTFAMSADGKYFATGNAGAQIYVWDLDRARLESVWRGVFGRRIDEGKVRRLSRHPKEAVVWLKDQLDDLVENEMKIRQEMARLDDDDFRVREAASQSLRTFDRKYDVLLRLVLTEALSPEAKRRAKSILDERFSDTTEGLWPTSDPIQRAVRFLSRIDVPEAQQALRELAVGPKIAFVTREARTLLERR